LRYRIYWYGDSVDNTADEFQSLRASEVTTLRHYTNLFIIIVIIIFLAHQHKACRQLKIIIIIRAVPITFTGEERRRDRPNAGAY